MKTKYSFNWKKITGHNGRPAWVGTSPKAPMYKICVEQIGKAFQTEVCTKQGGEWDSMDADKQPSGSVESICAQLIRRAEYIKMREFAMQPA